VAAPSPDEIRSLVTPTHVRGSAYVDPDLFELEMDRVFGQAWIFVAHDSQVREPGTYVTTRIGRAKVVVVRHTDDSIRVLHNRCPHRGTQVCTLKGGKVRFFQCGYHDWTFHTDGKLRSVPLHEGYADWQARRDSIGLEPVARVDQYRGFVFASLSPTGPSLADFLGYMKTSLDDLVDRAPGATHRSAVQAADAITVPLVRPAFGAHRSESLKANGAPLTKMDTLGVRAFPYGHSFIGGLPRPPSTGAVMDEYRGLLEQRHGRDRAAEILGVDRHINVIYPSLLTQGSFGQIKVIQPISVDLTETVVYPIRLKGAPDEVFRNSIRSISNANSPANFVLPDDMAMYQRTQEMLRESPDFWVDFGRGYGQEERDDHGGLRGRGTHELSMRNNYQAWLDYMVMESVR
jgi:nitrite reductase/ring-hydroxylating ferredoxin subunit